MDGAASMGFRSILQLVHMRSAGLVGLTALSLIAAACSSGGADPTNTAPTATPRATASPTANTAGATTPDETTTGSLQVRVTDAPGDATAVLVTVSSVQVNVQGASDEDSSWITVVEESRTFDLVALDGVEAVLGESELSAGQYGQIRLEVDEVEVVTPDRSVMATVPGGTLKLVGGFRIDAGVVTGVTIDFDLDRSLVEQGNGGFLFKPVVKLIVTEPGEPLDAPAPLLGSGTGQTPEPTLTPIDELDLTSTATPEDAPTPTQSPVGEFFLSIEAPESLEAVTTAQEFEVVGRSSLDALISVNDTVVELDVDGRFSVSVPLEDGVNVVEVVASVASGEELSEVLVIIREPQGS
ncbi:MAG: DUF4382 domain-containing protein [Chloroflexi bacterium]|nr:DUF4382 domain-containing protein [Chloroflexota bacterium]